MALIISECWRNGSTFKRPYNPSVDCIRPFEILPHYLSYRSWRNIWSPKYIVIVKRNAMEFHQLSFPQPQQTIITLSWELRKKYEYLNFIFQINYSGVFGQIIRDDKGIRQKIKLNIKRVEFSKGSQVNAESVRFQECLALQFYWMLGAIKNSDYMCWGIGSILWRVLFYFLLWFQWY